MDTKQKRDLFLQGHQTGADNRTPSQAFPVQTGLRAGGFIDSFLSWFEGWSAGYNEADAATGMGRWA
jgi:hypothetical protein